MSMLLHDLQPFRTSAASSGTLVPSYGGEIRYRRAPRYY